MPAPTLTTAQAGLTQIPPYDDWMRQTRAGVTKPRGVELRQVDLALKNYGEKRDQAAFEALEAAFDAWWNTKGDASKSIRNSTGAVTRLNDALLAIAKRDADGKAAMVQAKADIARMNRPAGFLAEIQGGKKKFDDGDLSGKFTKAGLAKISADPTSSNVFYEGFEGSNLQRAQTGWKNALLAAEKASFGMRAAAAGLAARNSAPTPERTRYETWFGTATSADIAQMLRKAEVVLEAMRTRPITFVLRENQTVHNINGADPLGPTTPQTMGAGTYGYIWNGAGGTHTGEGMRVVLCNAFLTDPCQYTGAAATIYHEITHKVIGTSDQSSAGVTTYGIPACKALARSDPASARNVADSWCYYAVSFLKAI